MMGARYYLGLVCCAASIIWTLAYAPWPMRIIAGLGLLLGFVWPLACAAVATWAAREIG